MRKLACFLVFALIAATACAAPPSTSHHGAATAATTAATTTTATSKNHFIVGSLHVQRYGRLGRPLILIPGLGSGAWVWKGALAHLRQNHVVYTVTLAGFDGTQPPSKKTGLMKQAQASLLTLIKSQHIDHPVLVGHSLGGTLALAFATQHSDLLAGVVAVDGLPIFPGMQTMTTAQRKAAAERMRAQMAKATPAQFKAQQLQYMQHIGVIDAAKARQYAAMQARSDPATTAQFMYEDLVADGRAGLKNIHVPVLEISPYNAPDFENAAKASKRPTISAEQKADYYRQLLDGVAQLQVVSIAPSRHFVMIDRPLRFQSVLDNFMSALPSKP
ncbi:MAG: alpha/beta hydrolase [Xanthomonadales bacterium]|nr:alpha/beta hydrolase [Xanthomonadales bacterium]